MTTPPLPEDFDAAKAVFEQLKDIPPERQDRILRWIAESFGIASATQSRVTAPAPPPPSEVGAAAGQHAGTPASTADIKSFVATKAPKSDTHFATAVAYYYRFDAPKGQRRDSIDATFLQEAARLAGRKRMKKPLTTLNNAKKSGLLDSAGRGEFAINSVGENLVAMTLPGGGSAVTATPRQGKAKGKKAGQGKKKR